MKSLNIIVVLLTITSCLGKQEGKNEPQKVIGIPEKAFWVGGPDGGNWFLVESINDHKNSAKIKIYNDNDGSLVVSKIFVLICPIDNPVFIQNLKEQINAFDGQKVLLNSVDDKYACYLQ